MEPASLRLALLALVAAPITFPGMTRSLFGTGLEDPDFERRYARDLRRILARLCEPQDHAADGSPGGEPRG